MRSQTFSDCTQIKSNDWETAPQRSCKGVGVGFWPHRRKEDHIKLLAHKDCVEFRIYVSAVYLSYLSERSVGMPNNYKLQRYVFCCRIRRYTQKNPTPFMFVNSPDNPNAHTPSAQDVILLAPSRVTGRGFLGCNAW